MLREMENSQMMVVPKEKTRTHTTNIHRFRKTQW